MPRAAGSDPARRASRAMPALLYLSGMDGTS